MRILDIDNCISNDAWRIPTIRWDTSDQFDRYHAYHMFSPFDEPGNPHLFYGPEAEGAIIITSRPEFYRGITEEWLRRAGASWSRLLMRPDDDHRPSVEVKREHVHSLLHSGIAPEQIECAYDDHLDIVRMYRRYGIRAEQVFIHQVSAYHAPQTQAAA